ncbi:hypothetical protein G7Y89_g10631 [Cudoniella acicularis]|uniref:Thiaminase-2/PQQC domain-containing protein n=1 Tax=Cudoniella acicularis TaxID=354080 RepID=A0A8H4VYK6_9HELO|nr:hypothetical protein G7Y89_g10631 [Cudoniella acicularis]
MALIPSLPMASIFPIPHQVPSARIRQAYVNMNTDAVNPTRGASIEDIHNRLSKRATTNTFIDSLWNNPSNQDLVSGFLNNNFSLTCAHGNDTECLPLYQKFSVQDYFYLEDYVKFKALRLNTLPVGDLRTVQSEAASIYDDANSAISFAESYVTELQGKATDLAEGNREVPELAYSNLLQSSATKEDWFNLHVIEIPCVYETAFLDANVAEWQSEIDTINGTGKWNNLFRTALKVEIAMFDSAFDQ